MVYNIQAAHHSDTFQNSRKIVYEQSLIWICEKRVYLLKYDQMETMTMLTLLVECLSSSIQKITKTVPPLSSMISFISKNLSAAYLLREYFGCSLTEIVSFSLFIVCICCQAEITLRPFELLSMTSKRKIQHA